MNQLCPTPSAVKGSQSAACAAAIRPLSQLLPGAEQLPRQSQQAIRRLHLLCLAYRWKVSGRPATEFLRHTTASVASLWRWDRRFARNGLAGLVMLMPGRKPADPVAAAARRELLAMARRMIRTREQNALKSSATASRQLRMTARDLDKFSRQLGRFSAVAGLLSGRPRAHTATNLKTARQ